MVWGIDFSPKGTEALYKERDGKLLIELELNSVMQIFNSFDPAPFHEKELDPEAEEYIYNTVGEFPLKKPLGIIIYVPSSEFDGETERTLKEAIRNHFSYKKVLTNIELRRLLQRGRRNMTIAIVFLFLCLLIIRLLSTLEQGLINTHVFRRPDNHRLGCNVGACLCFPLWVVAYCAKKKHLQKNSQHGYKCHTWLSR